MYKPIPRADDSAWPVPDPTSFALAYASESLPAFVENCRPWPQHWDRSGSHDVPRSEDRFSKSSEPCSESYPGRWSRYNVFTSEGRKLAHRKLLRSGPTFDEVPPNTPKSDGSLFARYTGWRMGTLICLIAVAASLVIELILLLTALSMSMGGFASGTLYKGSCSRVKSLTVWLLFPLNIIATVLISASNYVMQVMAAPDRKEVDYAHSLATSITIGGMRFRNLQFGGRRRRFIWWLLGVSSLPIHVLLNSAIYGSVQASDSGVLVVSDDFVSDTSWEACGSTLSQDIKTNAFACSLMKYFHAGRTVELSPKQCLNQYSDAFQTNASSVIVVTEPSSKFYFSLPDAGRIGSIGSAHGILCEPSDNESFLEIPPSRRHYQLDFDPSSGNATAYIPFMVNCANITNNSSGPVGAGADGPVLYSTDSAVFATDQDPLLNVSSFRSAFSAFEYRYWATAQLLGNNLDSPDLTFASQSWDSRAWLCPQQDLAQGIECDPTQLGVTMQDWYITSSSILVKACHILPMKEQCVLRYSPSILTITLFTDLVKLTAMLMALKLTIEPLATIGDAIESFLRRPDVYTEHYCLLDADAARKWSEAAAPLVKQEALRAALRKAPDPYVPASAARAKYVDRELHYTALRATRAPAHHEDKEDNDAPAPSLATPAQQRGGHGWSKMTPPSFTKAWTPRRTRWLAVPSKSRWVYYLCFFATLAAPTGYIFVHGLQSLRKLRVANFWTVGLSGPDPNALFTGGVLNVRDILWTAVVINTPQLLFSMLYFLFNALVTMMHTAHEWATLATERKALRVSSPRGRQRSTYWLQLPWAYSVPLIIASGSLHWLLGRSIYVVKVDVYDFFGDREAAKDFFACGYSPLTILGLVLVLGLMLAALAVLSVRRLAAGSPLVKLNSLAIAAACHRRFEDEDMVTQPLMWGVLTDDRGQETRLCAFSARPVGPLVEGTVYD